jgi:hypothetical protein
MPLSPHERSELNAALTNAADTLQAELEAYRLLLFVFLMNTAGSSTLHRIFDQARTVARDRILDGVPVDEGKRQRRVTLQALDGLEKDLTQVTAIEQQDALTVN